MQTDGAPGSDAPADLQVDVLIPCYNVARYLGDALDSVLRQQIAPHRFGTIVVVDDGSTDGVAAVAARFAPRVQYVRQAHAGIAAARNAALQWATSDVVAFLDADDLWPGESLRVRLDAMTETGADCVYGCVEQFVSPELPADLAHRHRETIANVTGESRAARLAGSFIVRRHALERVGGFDTTLRVGETIDWLARADAAGMRSYAIDAVVLRRRLHDTNSGARLADHRADYLRVVKASLDRRRAAQAAVTAQVNAQHEQVDQVAEPRA